MAWAKAMDVVDAMHTVDAVDEAVELESAKRVSAPRVKLKAILQMHAGI